jgi:peptide/nickel transport system permease protein
MIRFLVRRLLQTIPTLFGISLISFGIMVAAPGGPTAALQLDPRSNVQQRQARAEQLGINDPLPTQYLRWLAGDDWWWWLDEGEGSGNKGILRGDFGRSFSYKMPVAELIRERLQPTAELGFFSLLLGFPLGVILGLLAALNPGGWFDGLVRNLSVLLNSVPAFLFGLGLILIFGRYLDVLPMNGRCPVSISGECTLEDRAERLILPVLTLSVGLVAVLSRYMRAATLDVIHQDYVRTAQAKGLHPNTIRWAHVGRNALIPIATFLGPAIPGILGGAVIVEQLFGWQGLGRLALEAVRAQDYPVVMAFTMFGAVSTVFGFLLSDLLYALIDPRIQLDSGRGD